jgi:hypothetical protein
MILFKIKGNIGVTGYRNKVSAVSKRQSFFDKSVTGYTYGIKREGEQDEHN